MAAHIEDLAGKHKIRLRWVLGWGEAAAYPGQPLALVPVIRHPYEYLIALHELGHCVDPIARKFNDRGDAYSVALCEGAAWAWASVNASPALVRHVRAADWDKAAYAWRTYIAGPSQWRRDRSA